MRENTRYILARVTLYPIVSDNAYSLLRAGTRSLILKFPAFEVSDKSVEFGAMIDMVDKCAQQSRRDDIPVRIRFWVDEAAIHATPGERFTIWYGKDVGDGVVERVVDNTTDM